MTDLCRATDQKASDIHGCHQRRRTGAYTNDSVRPSRQPSAAASADSDRTPKAVLTLYTAQEEDVKPADWSRWNAEPEAVGVHPLCRAS